MLNWKVLENGDLKIYVMEGEKRNFKRFIREGRAEDRDFSAREKTMWEAFEGIIESGLEWVAPERIGALTSAPILSDWHWPMYPDHEGELDGSAPPDDVQVWWYPNYMVRSPIDDLIEDGYTIFTKAEAETPSYEEGLGHADK